MLPKQAAGRDSKYIHFKVNINLMSFVTGKLILLSREFYFLAPSHQKEQVKNTEMAQILLLFWIQLLPQKNIKSLLCKSSLLSQGEHKVNRTKSMQEQNHEIGWHTTVKNTRKFKFFNFPGVINLFIAQQQSVIIQTPVFPAYYFALLFPRSHQSVCYGGRRM